MTENQKWIEDLKKRIIEDDDKILFEEASGCFVSGYYRAAFIISWVGLIESLKKKIFILSNFGDNRATTAKEKIEEAENNKLSTDKLIFEEAKNIGILDDSDYSIVSFLWEQRCLFAHPYNKNPEIDEVKYIIGQVIRISLGRELYFNKSYLNDLAENISKKPFFLPTEIDRVRKYAERIISRTPEKLHSFFFKTLLFKVGELSKNEENFFELRKLRYFLVELFINTPIPLNNPDWSLEYRVTNFPYECYIGFVHQETWLLLPDRIKEMLIGYLESERDNTKLIALNSITSNLIKNKVLEDQFKNRYYKKLNILPFDSAIHFYGDPKAVYDRIISELESNQYDKQNLVIDYLRSEKAIELISGLDKEKQIKLGHHIRIAATRNHWKSQNFVSAIKQGYLNYSDWLKAGIALSGFISFEGKFELDERYLKISIEIINELTEEIQNEVYNRIEETISKDEISEWDLLGYNEEKFSEITKDIIDNLENWNTNNQERFLRLIEIIRNYFAQQKI